MRNESRIVNELGKRLHDALEEGPSRARRNAQRKDVESMVNVPARRSGAVRIGLAVAAGVATLVAVVLLARLPAQPDPMEYWVGAETKPRPVAERIAATDASLDVRFTDGSRIEIAQGSGIRVSQATRKNVTVTLDDGDLDVDIREKGTTIWKILAGPYSVTVHGTAFSVSWNEQEQTFAVKVRRGLVSVDGPDLSPGGMMLGADESLLIDEPERVLARNAPEPQPAPAPSPPPEEQIDEEPAPAPTVKHHAPSWKKLSKQGRYKEAIALVEKNFTHLTKTLDQQDLWELATTARLARRGPLAAKALDAFRTRFPDSHRAATAEFLLGRVEMELNKKPVKAAKWFKAYLKDNPDGSLAEEALGRLMSAYRKAGNDTAAERTASKYLEKYPSGTFRELALSIVSSP